MGNRERDFTSATIDGIMTELSGDSSEYTTFRTFSSKYGNIFDFDFSQEMNDIDTYVTDLRAFLFEDAPNELNRINRTEYEIDEFYGNRLKESTNNIVAYGNRIDALSQMIGSGVSPADFINGTSSSQTVMQLSATTEVLDPGLWAQIVALLQSAGVAVAVDGPLPFGDIIAAILVAIAAGILTIAAGKALIYKIGELLSGDESDSKSESEDAKTSEGTSAGDVKEGDINDLPENVKESYKDYEKNGWEGKSTKTPGTKDNGTFKNNEGKLPEKDAEGNDITYKEHDVNNKVSGEGRDAERFVTGSDGSVYYTNDHYDTFIKLK